MADDTTPDDVRELEPSDDGWLYLEHPETGGTTRISAAAPPEVLQVHEARGWRPATPPDTRTPFVPAKPNVDPDAAPAEWLDLVHPDVPGGVNRIPNHPDALAGAELVGWRLPDADPDAVEAELRRLHPRGGKATDAERAAAEQTVAEQAAAADEPPVIDTAPDNPVNAGNGTEPKE